MSDHTPEPWQPVPIYPLASHRFVEIKRVDYARAVACVNACEGIKDPSVAKELVDFVRWASKGTDVEMLQEGANYLLEKLDE